MASETDSADRAGDTWSHIAPIFNFTSQVDTFSLGPFVLRRLTDEERNTISHAARQMSFTLFAEMSAAEYGICGSESRIGSAAFQFDEVCADVITALRLVRDGAVYLNLQWSWRTSDQGETSLRTPMQPIAVGSIYDLNQNDLDVLTGVYDALPTSVRKKKGLRRAIRRFNFAYQRSEDEDRLVDYWVALEGLFLGERSSELRFRAALRIAHFIGESAEDRWSTFTEMKRSYDLRSSVVHGARVDHAEVKAVTGRTQEVLRTTLRRIVLGTKKLNPEDLDRLAVEGGR